MYLFKKQDTKWPRPLAQAISLGVDSSYYGKTT